MSREVRHKTQFSFNTFSRILKLFEPFSPLEALQPRKIYSSVQTQSLWNSWIQNYPSHAWEALRAPAVHSPPFKKTVLCLKILISGFGAWAPRDRLGIIEYIACNCKAYQLQKFSQEFVRKKSTQATNARSVTLSASKSWYMQKLAQATCAA